MRVGSDHAPIVLSTTAEKEVRGAHFYFEKQWLLLPGFKDEVYMKMVEAMLAQTNKCALDMWQRMLAQLRKFLRGFGANIRGNKEGGRRNLGGALLILMRKLTKMSWMVQVGLLDMCWRRR
jgi:hypothetical protein